MEASTIVRKLCQNQYSSTPIFLYLHQKTKNLKTSSKLKNKPSIIFKQLPETQIRKEIIKNGDSKLKIKLKIAREKTRFPRPNPSSLNVNNLEFLLLDTM
jgi:hypothetical protein